MKRLILYASAVAVVFSMLAAWYSAEVEARPEPGFQVWHGSIMERVIPTYLD